MNCIWLYIYFDRLDFLNCIILNFCVHCCSAFNSQFRSFQVNYFCLYILYPILLLQHVYRLRYTNIICNEFHLSVNALTDWAIKLTLYPCHYGGTADDDAISPKKDEITGCCMSESIFMLFWWRKSHATTARTTLRSRELVDLNLVFDGGVTRCDARRFAGRPCERLTAVNYAFTVWKSREWKYFKRL